MTIDERLDALTHALELVAQMQLKTEKELHTLGRYIRAIVLDHEARLLVIEGDDKGED
jgi:predicted component of type VI protein secretion system